MVIIHTCICITAERASPNFSSELNILDVFFQIRSTPVQAPRLSNEVVIARLRTCHRAPWIAALSDRVRQTPAIAEAFMSTTKNWREEETARIYKHVITSVWVFMALYGCSYVFHGLCVVYRYSKTMHQTRALGHLVFRSSQAFDRICCIMISVFT